MLEFIIYSEAEDNELLNVVFKRLSKEIREEKVSDFIKHKIHFFVHYLKIKAKKCEVSSLIGKELD